MTLLGAADHPLAFVIACSAKVTLLFIFAWIGARVARHRTAESRHLVWATGIVGSLALPLVTLLLPAWHSTTLESAGGLWGPARLVGANHSSQTLPSMIVNARTDSLLSSELPGLVLLLWTAGFLIVAARLVAGFVRLARVSARSKPMSEEDWMRAVLEVSTRLKITRRVRVLQCGNETAMPITWGVFRPLIVLPAGASEWSEKRRRIVLSHELAHIARGDSLLQICAEMARGFYWFHPFTWIAARRLREESECACDDFVLNSGIEPSEYATQLLDLARTLENPGGAWSLALALALVRPSQLERRFTAMLNPSTERRQMPPRAKLLTAFSALCLVLPLGALQLSAQNQAGKFTGTVLDPSGAAVPNATIIMTNPKTDRRAMTTSDANGNYKFTDLTAGAYEMKVLKSGFEEYKVPQVTFEPGHDSSLSMTLKVGTVTEQVDVVAQGKVKALPGTAGEPRRLRLGGDLQAPKLLDKIQPVYPAAAKAAGVQGTVTLHAIIGLKGDPLSLRVVNTQVDPELARAAVEAVSKWRYSPTLLNGDPIEVDTTVTVNFTLLP